MYDTFAFISFHFSVFYFRKYIFMIMITRFNSTTRRASMLVFNGKPVHEIEILFNENEFKGKKLLNKY